MAFTFVLTIHNLSAGYDDFPVLRGVSLAVSPGEMVVLIGPNGAGKSTVLKSVAGLTKKTGGTILFEDKDITSLSTSGLIEQGIGFVPQGRLVFSSLSVDENLDVGAYTLNHRETMEKNREDVFRHFPALREKRRERAGNLSGGQQQQLAIGRALMTSPKLLMLDEPSLGLSPKLASEVFVQLKRLQESGVALLVVEQNVRLALRHAHRGYLLANGAVRLEGSAAELSDDRVMREAFLQ